MINTENNACRENLRMECISEIQQKVCSMDRDGDEDLSDNEDDNSDPDYCRTSFQHDR